VRQSRLPMRARRKARFAYLSTKVEGKRRMVYIPRELEEEVRRRVGAYREVERLTDVVSAACVHRVLERKRKRKSNGEEGQ
jgi:hypothetical protein